MNTDNYKKWAEHLKNNEIRYNEDFIDMLNDMVEFADSEIKSFTAKINTRKQFIQAALYKIEEIKKELRKNQKI